MIFHKRASGQGFIGIQRQAVHGSQAQHHEFQSLRHPIQRLPLRAAAPFTHLLQPPFPLWIRPALPADRGRRRRADPQIVPAFPVPQIVAAPETIPGKVGYLIMMQPGLLEQPDNLYSEAAGFPDLDPGQTVVLATGTQGEALSALARIARGEHRQLSLHEGDTVIMSSRVIPGNARAISKVLNQIYRLGAEVYHHPGRTVHATGHACQAELREIIEAVKPEYFIPVHGEYRHLALHARLAEECGVAHDHIKIIEDGQPVTFLEDGIRMEDPVSVESVMVDGKGVGDVGRMVLKERRILGGEGLVAVVLVIAEETGEVLHGPEMISRGFVFEQQYSHLLEDAKCLVLDQLESTNPNDIPRLSDRIRSSLRRFFRDVLGRDPIVVPIVTQI